MSVRAVAVGAFLVCVVPLSVHAQEYCALFQPAARCGPARVPPAFSVTFGKADLPQVASRKVAAPKPPAPVDCELVQPAAALVTPGMVLKSHHGPQHLPRPVAATPCRVLNKHR